MAAPARVETARLIMSVPRLEEAAEILDRYAGDPAVTRYLGWATHQGVADTKSFVEYSTSQWEREGLGPYLIRDRESGKLLGSTGLGIIKVSNTDIARRQRDVTHNPFNSER